MITGKKFFLARAIDAAWNCLLGFGKAKFFYACSAIFLFISTAFFTKAQSFTTTIAQPKIGKNQYAEVTYEIQEGGRIDNFQAPQFKDWEVVSGPNNSSYTSNMNGRVSRRTSFSYYLQPLKTGKLIVQGAKAIVDGKAMVSNTTVVEVMNKNVAEPQANNNNPDPFSNIFDDPFSAEQQAEAERRQQAENDFTNTQILRPNEDINKKITDNVILRAVTSKNTCYEGEPIVATYKIYTRLDLVNADFTKRPSFSGFSAYDLDVPDRNYSIEDLNGKKYRVYTYRKVQLYPLQSGLLTLDPVELDFTVKLVKYEAVANGYLNPNDDNNFIQKAYVLKSPAASIQVLPLPTAGRPADFKGAVGDFHITAATDVTDPGKDDAVDLHVKISGTGNFSMVHAPTIAWPKNVEAYDPDEKESLIKSQVPIAGEKNFSYVFLCHQPGNTTIPAIHFSYFDIASKLYKTISTQAIPLTVASESKRPSLKDNDNNDTNWPQTFINIAQYVLPVLASCLVVYLLFTFMFRRKQKQKFNENKAMEDAWDRLVNETKPDKEETAVTNGTTHVEETITYTHHDQDDQKYMPTLPTSTAQTPAIITAEEDIPRRNKDHVSVYLPQSEDALWEQGHQTFYLALKSETLHAMAMAANLSNTNKSTLLAALQQKGVDTNVLQQLNIILDECDAAIYSPVDMGNDRKKTLEEAGYLIGCMNGNSTSNDN